MDATTLPLGPEYPLEVGRLADLVFEAILAGARDLSDAPIEEHDHTIIRKGLEPPTVWETHEVRVPDYRASIADAAEPRLVNSAEGKALTDYIWNAGALPRKLDLRGRGRPGRDGAGPPTRDTWAWWTWSDLVREPLSYLLWLSATRDLTETGSYRPWHLDGDEARAAAIEVATVACGGPRSVRAVCPVIRRVVSEGFSLSLSPGVTLRAWSVEEECLFSNRFSGEYHPEDRAVNSGDAVLEIVLPHVGREDDEIAQAITSAVDLAKWALMAAESRDEWFIEGAIVVRSPSGWRGATIRREDTLRPVGYFMGGLGDEPAARAAALFQRARRLFETVPSLRNVVWFLGRALLANTARDSLLEAAIGLESLLVDGSGEVSYRFRLHGASVLSSLLKEDAFSDLAEIYRLRSGAAHGDDRERTEVQRLAPRCRYLLAQALVAVLDLVDSGELRPLANERKLSPAIGRLVKRRAIGLE